MRRKPGRHIFRYMKIALLGGLLLVVAEVACRTFPSIMLPRWQIRHFLEHTPHPKIVSDADIGFLVFPEQRELITTRDFTYLRETDRHGFVNREPWPEQVEMVFLGDSLLAGAGVGIDGSFPRLVAQQLPDHGVVNLGVPGAGPERQLRIYQRFGVQLQPRLVVACWYLASDLHNDALFHAWLQHGQGLDYNSFRLHPAARRSRTPRRWRFSPRKLVSRSWLYGMGQELVLRWRGKAPPWQDSWRFADGTEILFDWEKLAFATTAVAVEQASIDALFTSLEQLQGLVASHDAALVVVLIPSKEEIFAPDVALDGTSVVGRVRHKLQETNMAVLDLYGALRQAGTVQSPYFSRDIHLNRHGNHIVAEQFVSWFRSRFAAKKE